VNSTREWLSEAGKLIGGIAHSEATILAVDLVFQETTGAQVTTLKGEVLEVLHTCFVLTTEAGATLPTLRGAKCHPVANGDHCDIGRHGNNFTGVLVTT
jgi:hypothetical protein